jgi:L-asparaginase II
MNPTPPEYPDNPILVRRLRGERVESVHRGAWVLVDLDGRVLDGAGAVEAPVFARSSTKALQALACVESGAADRFGFDEAQLALACASHNGEHRHTEVVARMLEATGSAVSDLRCGAHAPYDAEASEALRESGNEPTAIHNNCSGKHAAFLALARHLGDEVSGYLDPGCRSQQLVRAAVQEMTGASDGELEVAVDGCSAPTFRLPLTRLAHGFARFANPEGLEPGRRVACERLASAVAHHPDLIGASRNQVCSDIARVTGGRLFPKIGAEAVYVIGDRGGERALALKMDDGSKRGLHPLLVDLLRRFEFIDAEEQRALSAWEAGPLRNWAGLEVGRAEVIG